MTCKPYFTGNKSIGLKVNGFDINSARKLESAIYEFNRNQFEIELDIRNLYYQKFVSMNGYINIVAAKV